MYSKMSPKSVYDVSDRNFDVPTFCSNERIRAKVGCASHRVHHWNLGKSGINIKTHQISKKFNYSPHYAQIEPSLAFPPARWIVWPNQSPTT